MLSRFIFCVFLMLSCCFSTQAQTARIDSLHHALESAKIDITKAALYNELSEEFWYHSLDTSMMYALRTLKILKDKNDKKLEAEATNNLGVAFWLKGEYPNAMRSLLASLKMYEVLKEKELQAMVSNNIGLVYHSQKNYHEASRQFKKALSIYTKSPEFQQEIASTLGYLSESLLAMNQQDSALAYAFQALEISKTLKKDLNIANHLGNIGKILMEHGKFQVSEEYLKEGLYILDTLHSEWGLAHIYKDLAVLADSTNQTNQMVIYAQKSYDLAKKQEARDVLMTSSDLLAKGLAAQGLYKEAFFYLEEAGRHKDLLFNERKDKELYSLEIRQKDKEIALANQQRVLEAKGNKQKNIIIFSIGGALLLMAVMAALLFKGREKEKKGNSLLLQKNEEIQHKTNEIHEIFKSLELKNEQITRSINAAKTIQQAILPFESRLKELLKEHFILYRPKDIVSGDFYWVDRVGNKTIVAVIDCTGHGVPGAFMSMIGNTLLDEIITIKKIIDPAAILEELNKQIIASLRQEETRDLNGMDIAIACFEEEKNGEVAIEFAGAKRPLYYFSPSEKEIITVKGTTRHIGGRQITKRPFENKQLKLPAGSMIYLTSDGYEDQNNANRRKVGRIKFLELLKRNAPNPVSIQKNSLETYLSKQTKGVEQRDDIMILGIRI